MHPFISNAMTLLYRASKRTFLNAESGAEQRVRYVFRKGSHISEKLSYESSVAFVVLAAKTVC